MATYSKITDKSNGNRPIQVESAIRDGDGKNIVNNYSKQNGYYANMGVGQADELSTTRQIENPETACPPIVMGITGGSAEIKTGIENFEYLEGNSFAFNQLVKNGNFATDTNWNNESGVTHTISNNEITVTSTTISNGVQQDLTQSIISGHVYLISFYAKSSDLINITVGCSGVSGVRYGVQLTSSYQEYSVIKTATGSSVWVAMFVTQTGSFTAKKFMLIDLTLIYGAGNEPTTVADFKSRFPLDYYAYNSGSILSAKTNALISRGRQQWDEQWELGYYDRNTGQKDSANNYVRCKNLIPVIGGETYYFRFPSAFTVFNVLGYDINGNLISGFLGDKTSITSNDNKITIPNKVSYIAFFIEDTTYHNDITISIYFEDGECYDDYYPYSQDSVALPNIELRAIGDIKDIAYASGGGKRKLGIVDLSTLTWTTTAYGYSTQISNMKYDGTHDSVGVCSKYVYVDYQTFSGNHTAGTFSITGKYIGIATSETPSGYLLYPLETETDLTENTGWDDTIAVDNYGTLEFTTNPQQVPQVPQPYFIKYTISLKELLDSIYVNAGGDADDIVYEEELQSVVDNLENGTLVVAKAEVADNLTPYDDESGEEQTQPFALQGTGCGNGEQIVDTGSFAQLKEKQGNSVVVNQLVQNNNFQSSTGWIAINGTISVSSNVLTLTATNNGNSAIGRSDYSAKAGHKYFVFAFMKATSGKTLYISGANADKTLTADGNWQVLEYIDSVVSSSSGYPKFGLQNALANDTCQIKLVYFVDLTLWFGSNDNIPAYLLAHPESFFNYHRGSLAYNVGTLTNANGQNLKCIGRNQWDETWEVGGIDDNGSNLATNTIIRSKGYIEVAPNETYYAYIYGKNARFFFYDTNKNFISYYDRYGNGTFEIPSNAKYVRFILNTAYGTTYNHNITVSLYYAGESGYDQYYPYELLTNVDTGTETLRSAGDYKDIKENSGLITRVVGTKTYSSSDVGDTGVTYVNVHYFYVPKPNDYLYKGSYTATKGNVLCNKYPSRSAGDFDNANWIGTIDGSANTNYFWVCFPLGTTLDQAKTAINGMEIHYALKEENYVEEEGTPFNPNIDIDDFGTMEWDAENYNGIPQGATVFYPVDYKAMLDSLNNRIDGDVSELVIQSERTADKTSQATLDSQLKNAIGGTLRQCLCVKDSLNFNNTKYVDISSFTNCILFTANQFYFDLGDVEHPSGSTEIGKILCTMYERDTYVHVYNKTTDKTIALNTNGYALVYDTSYSTVDQFLTAMKGVLLAYKKA